MSSTHTSGSAGEKSYPLFRNEQGNESAPIHGIVCPSTSTMDSVADEVYLLSLGNTADAEVNFGNF